jgi:hypothetical protein
MARYSNVTTNFSGGLITDNLIGRTDLPRTANSCRKMENFLPTLQGPTSFRQGFEQHVVNVGDTADKMIQVMLTLGTVNKYRIVFTPFEVNVYDSGGVLKTATPVATPYTEDQLKDLRFSAETDILYIAHPSHRPRYLAADITYDFATLQSTETDSSNLSLLDQGVVKIVSTANDFTSVASDYSGGTPDEFSQDWFIEFDLGGVTTIGRVVAATSEYSEVVPPTDDTVYVYIDYLPSGETAITPAGSLTVDLLGGSGNQLRAAVAFAGDDSWSLNEIPTLIEPFLEDDVTGEKLTLFRDQEVVKLVSTANDFTDIVNDYTGGTPNQFSKDWYVEFPVDGSIAIGKVVDSATHYSEVVAPTANTVYVDAVDFVTEIKDTAAKFYLLDNNETTVALDQTKLENDDVPIGEVHLRSDTSVFGVQTINSFIRVPQSRQSDEIVVGYGRTTDRWVKVSEYVGTEAHPVEFIRGTDCGDFTEYDYGSVYRSYGSDSFDVKDSHNNKVGAVASGGNRAFTWNYSLSNATFSATSLMGNLSTAKTMDVVKCDPAFRIETGYNLIVPAGAVAVTGIANDVTVVATGSTFFDPDHSIGRHIKCKFPSGVAYMKILAWNNGSSVRAKLSTPIPTTEEGVYESNGVAENFAMGAWYTGNYPRTVAKYERRRIYGGTYTHPNFVFFSKLGDETNFAPTDKDGTVLDTNGFSYPLSNVNASTRWMLASEHLIIGTSQGIFKLAINQYEVAVSPKTVRIELVDDVNCDGEAFMLGTSVFFPDESRTRLMEYKYDQNIQRFNANDLAKFLYPTFLTDQIKRIAIQEAPQSRVWVLTDSGLLYSLVYQRQEDYYAWSKHTTNKYSGDLAKVHDICVVKEGFSSGLDMVVTPVTRTLGNTVQYDVLSDESPEMKIHLDSAQVFNIAPTGSNYSSGKMLIDVTDIPQLSSQQSVAVVVDGVDMGDFSEDNGYLRVPMQTTTTELKVVVGVRYTGRLQPMYPTWDGANKPAFGTDEIRVISSRIYLVNSACYKYGIDGKYESIELDGFVSAANKAGNASKVQTRYTGFDKEKPVAGSYFGVDKTPEIIQDTANELTAVALITKTDLN